MSFINLFKSFIVSAGIWAIAKAWDNHRLESVGLERNTNITHNLVVFLLGFVGVAFAFYMREKKISGQYKPKVVPISEFCKKPINFKAFIFSVLLFSLYKILFAGLFSFYIEPSIFVTAWFSFSRILIELAISFPFLYYIMYVYYYSEK